MATSSAAAVLDPVAEIDAIVDDSTLSNMAKSRKLLSLEKDMIRRRREHVASSKKRRKIDGTATDVCCNSLREIEVTIAELQEKRCQIKMNLDIAFDHYESQVRSDDGITHEYNEAVISVDWYIRELGL